MLGQKFNLLTNFVKGIINDLDNADIISYGEGLLIQGY